SRNLAISPLTHVSLDVSASAWDVSDDPPSSAWDGTREVGTGPALSGIQCGIRPVTWNRTREVVSDPVPELMSTRRRTGSRGSREARSIHGRSLSAGTRTRLGEAAVAAGAPTAA